MSHAELAKSDLVAVYDITCHAPRSGYQGAEAPSVTEIVVLRRGLFVIETHGREIVADVGSCLVLGPQEEFRVAHPGSDGDVYTLLRGAEWLIEEALGSVRGAACRLQPRQSLVVGLFTTSLRSTSWDQLEAEEIALLLLASIGDAFGRPGSSSEPSLPKLRSLRIDRTRALLAAAPALAWRLGIIAREVGCSPFHLARDFRRATGETIGTYLLRLRLGIAIDRMAGGEDDLASLAVESGFSHHSHFTSRFHRVFGLTPSTARSAMTRPRVDDLRSLLSRQPSDNR
jgi:AraC family transcriptional regulator